MSNIRLSKALCSAVSDAMQGGSHAILEALFSSAGAPGDPPNLSHADKWKDWLFRAGQDENVDSLSVLGNILEEFMDVKPLDTGHVEDWLRSRERVISALENDGFRYFRGGRVMPNGLVPVETSTANAPKPSSVQELLEVLVKGLPRAIYPLVNRRKGSVILNFNTEYDIQDLLHAMMRPWIADIRPEEFTPSYAGASTRMDFLLPAHSLVIETKLVRSKSHSAKIGDELIIDIDHYKTHPECKNLWCVIYDPNHHIENVGGLTHDLEGQSKNSKGEVTTKVFVV